jgi:hypothetical protein
MAAAVREVLGDVVLHEDPMRAAEAAASHGDAVLIGPLRSRDVAHAVEVTAPAGVPLLAPAATWVGVTRDDEPGCDDPARHRGTVLRIVARDMVVARRLAAHLRANGLGARVIAGDHEYGEQLAAQLRAAGLPDGDDLVVLCGLAGHEECDRAREAGLPVIAFDGVQGHDLGPDVRLALPFAPSAEDPLVAAARRAAELVRDGRGDLDVMRRLGPFDEHGDPVDPPVWLWRAARDWSVAPESAV